MAVMMVTGNAANIPDLGLDMPFQPVRTMTATVAAGNWARFRRGVYITTCCLEWGSFCSSPPLPSIHSPLAWWVGRESAAAEATYEAEDEAAADTKLAVGIITAVAALVVAPIVLVILYILVNGISAINWEFLTAAPRDGMTHGGIMPAILGTLILTLGTAIVCIPLGLFAAIYLAEYAGDNRLTRWVRLAIVNLAGIPSIVYGLFGLGALCSS